MKTSALCASGAVVMLCLSYVSAFAAPAPVEKVLVMDPDVKVYQLEVAGTTEEVPAWSEKARQVVKGVCNSVLAGEPMLQAMPMPELTPTEKAALAEHVALFDTVEAQVFQARQMGGVWNDRLKHFDYTVGPGLRFLKQETGADKLLIVSGRDYESTGGRKAMFIFAAAFGVGIGMGGNYLTSGLVDLDTGHIDWLNLDTSGASDFTNDKSMVEITDSLLKKYPEGSLHSATAAVR